MPFDPITGKQLSVRDYSLFNGIRSLMDAGSPELRAGEQLRSDANPENLRQLEAELNNPNLSAIARRILLEERSKMHDSTRQVLEANAEMYKLSAEERKETVPTEVGTFRGVRGIPSRWRDPVGSDDAPSAVGRNYPKNWYDALKNFVDANVPVEGDSEEAKYKKMLQTTGFGGILAGAKGAANLGGDVAKRYAAAQAQQGKVSDYELWRNYRAAPGLEGNLRHEISDAGAQLRQWPIPRNAQGFRQISGRMEDVLSHPELYQAHPILARAPTHVVQTTNSRFGSFNPDSLRIDAGSNSPDDFLRVLLHELQHGMQRLEGHAGGTNPVQALMRATQAGARPESRAMLDHLNQLGYTSPEMRAYARHAGEVEARNVEWRQANPDATGLMPVFTEDMFRSWQILGR